MNYSMKGWIVSIMEKKQKILLIILAAWVLVSVITYLLIPDLFHSLWFGGDDIGNSLGALDFEYTVSSDKTTCTITGLSSLNFQNNITIPSKIGKYTVISIGDYAFANTTIKTITIPSTVRTIGKGAFGNCELLTSVYGLENCENLLQIPEDTFRACSSLNNIELPPNIVYIGKRAFAFCEKLESIDFPAKLKKIDDHAFTSCESLSRVEFSDSIITLGSTVFGACNELSEIVLPVSVTNYSTAPFAGCQSLATIIVAEDNAYVSVIDNSIYNKELTTIWCYPSGKTDKEFIVPEGIENIGPCTFAYNNHLESVTIPKTVTLIYQNVFTKSPNIKNIYYNGTVQEWQAIKKYTHWRMDSSDFIIVCTDGQISKDGTVTYN